MQRYTVYLYLETALHVSGGTSTHHQERIQLTVDAKRPFILTGVGGRQYEWSFCIHRQEQL
jgi:hypothetical protein